MTEHFFKISDALVFDEVIFSGTVYKYRYGKKRFHIIPTNSTPSMLHSVHTRGHISEKAADPPTGSTIRTDLPRRFICTKQRRASLKKG